VTAPGDSSSTAISIAELTSAAKDVLEGAFPKMWVKGEISGFKAYPSGHWYFTLKDATSQISGVMWKGSTLRVPAKPTDGMQVMALGQLTVNPGRGQMQFVVTALEAEGEGLWQKQFDETKAKLEREGITTRPRKSIPRFPRTVAVITSSEAAVWRDIQSVIRRRNAGVNVVLIPSQVQGDGAIEALCDALSRLDQWVRGSATWAGTAPAAPDVLIIGRGGGSREDLWAFNHESVARAIAACRIPTISAVGHETDVTIADLVADLRAATPSVAAESAVPVLAEVRQLVAKLAGTMADALQNSVQVGRRDLAQAADGLSLRAQRVTERRRARAQRLIERVKLRAPRLLDSRRASLATAAGKLDALSPLAVLKRGFGVARGADGATLARLQAFRAGMPFDLLIQDGRVRATAESMHTDAPHLKSTK